VGRDEVPTFGVASTGIVEALSGLGARGAVAGGVCTDTVEDCGSTCGGQFRDAAEERAMGEEEERSSRDSLEHRVEPGRDDCALQGVEALVRFEERAGAMGW
jgi:hypothetical protein